ncbi:hypothetical protein [uncultured Methanofollis sp.]|uniref:hypothetical protein n=1 Tax=uncultured Methanofollis sp. TaxID=262500 RepID=UPI0026025E37|nr:hypothetical protein [uncultured Methanofollis sp.]
MTRKQKGALLRPMLMALLLVCLAAVPAVSAYTANDIAYSEKLTVPTRVSYTAETSVSQTVDEIYTQANLWYDDGSSYSCVQSSPMEHYYNSNGGGAYDTYSSPSSGNYKCRGYRAIVENGVVSKNWFDQSGWTSV